MFNMLSFNLSFRLVFLNFFTYLFLLEYSCSTMFISFNKVDQLHVYLYSLFFVFPSHLRHHRSLSRIPCAIHSQFSQVMCSLHGNVYMSIPISQCFPLSLPPPTLVTVNLYFCDSISALQINLSVPFF